MKIDSSFARRLGWAALLVPAISVASIGKVVALEGTAWRVPGADTVSAKATQAPPVDDSKKVALKVGSEIELGDNVVVDASSNVKLGLNDESVLALGEHSQLWVSQANFANLDHRTFSAKLWFGKVWAKVNKALSGSDAKFEVSTPRAVAGVRGTIFRIDAVKVLSAASNKVQIKKTTVKVAEGKVAVEAKKPAGPRHEVSGPQEISADTWEKNFILLQAKQEVTINELGQMDKKATAYDPTSDNDALAAFVNKNP